MAFSETFNDDLTVTVGNPTKASDFNNLANNTDALKERFVKGHYFNNTGVNDEDGFHKLDYTDPVIFLAKSTGNLTYKYMNLWMDVSNVTDGAGLRFSLASTSAAPASPTAGAALGGGGLSLSGANLTLGEVF